MTDHVIITDLRSAVAELLEEPPDSLGEEENLIERGLDSIRLMHLANQWRAGGREVSFAELAIMPTLNAWQTLLSERAIRPSPQPETAPQPAKPPQGDDDASFGLAPMQHAYWIGRGEGQALGGVAAHLYAEFDGHGVDPERLQDAAQALVARHEMLRVRLAADGSQQVSPPSRLAFLSVHDLRHLRAGQVPSELEALRQTLSHQMLDIEDGQVFDLHLSLLPDGRTRLHIDIDMVASDAMSYRTIIADLAQLYEQPGADLPPIAYRYRTYLEEHAARRADARENARRWWQDRLSDMPRPAELPVIPESERPQAARSIRMHHWLPAEARERLVQMAHRRAITPAMALATAFAEVISGWSSEQRFLLNLPMFDREPLHPDVPKLAGDFTNSLLLDVDTSQDVPFAERARAIQSRMHSDAAHSDYTGLEVLRDLGRSRGEQIIAPVVYTSALNLGELFAEAVYRCFGEPVWTMSQGPQVLLDAQVTELRGGLLLNWDVRSEAFPEGVIEAMFAAYQTLLERLSTSEDAWDAAPLQPIPAHQAAIRQRVNATQAPASARLLHERFFEHALQTPAAQALAWADSTMTYGDLADRALRVASYLQSRGAVAGENVAIILPKGPEQVVATLGVLAAGCTYVPINVEQPPARRERIREIAHIRFGLAAGEDVDAPGDGFEVLDVAEAARSPEKLASLVPVGREDAAYVLFTSGSTGIPKGVQIPHRAAVNTIEDLTERFGLGPSDRSLALSALDFDLSVFDIFGLLSVGGGVILVDETSRRDAAGWIELLNAHQGTVLNCVPAFLDMLLLGGESTPLSTGLRLVLLGGDWINAELFERLRTQVPACRFVALGGTTETAIHSTIYEVTDRVPDGWRPIPYGVPLRNVHCRVVDRLGRDRPDWATGELWIGGEGVALGYLGDSDLTQSRFLHTSDQHSPDQRWYRTGDMARYWPDGTLEFLGRADDQVKVRGFRIELGDVEAALEAHPGVTRAVAWVSAQPRPRLVAGVTADISLDMDELRRFARAQVPEHMVPDPLVQVPEILLTANGKVDRRALGTMVEATRGTTTRVAPRTTLEEVIAAVWRDLLNVADIGVEDDFFALGGDSVLATAAADRLREALLTPEISVRVLLSSTTIAELAATLLVNVGDTERMEKAASIYMEVERMSAAEVERVLGRNDG